MIQQEIHHYHPAAEGKRSSFDLTQGGVHVVMNQDKSVLMYDGKRPTGPVHFFTHGEWVAFLAGVKTDEFYEPIGNEGPLKRIPRKVKKEMKKSFSERVRFRVVEDKCIVVYSRKQPSRLIKAFSQNEIQKVIKT